MEICKLIDQIPFFEQEKIKAWKVFSGEESEQILMVLEPGAVLQPHTTDFDAQFHILKGNAEIIIEEKKYNLVENETVLCSGNKKHGINNPNNESVNVLITKIYNRKPVFTR